MPIIARVVPTMATRPCDFCLSLQEDSVFADFNVDEEGRVKLQRISFDGFGCCNAHGSLKKMNSGDSRLLLNSVRSESLEDGRVGAALRTYFEENSEVIWRDALEFHGLLVVPENGPNKPVQRTSATPPSLT